MREDDKSCDRREKSFKVLRKCYIRASYNSENVDSAFGSLMYAINTLQSLYNATHYNKFYSTVMLWLPFFLSVTFTK